MWRLSCYLLAAVLAYVRAMGPDVLIGEGVWDVHLINKCPDSDDLPIKISLERRRISRTQDAYDSDWHIDRMIDDTYGVKMEMLKCVDGGCKLYNTVTDNSVVQYVRKMVEENMKQVMTLAGIDPPDFPINSGDYVIKEYVLDRCEFPCRSVLGRFETTVHLVSKENELLACVKVITEFREPESEEEMCDKCKE